MSHWPMLAMLSGDDLRQSATLRILVRYQMRYNRYNASHNKKIKIKVQNKI